MAPPRARRSVLRRVAPRLVGDVVAVVVGLMVFGLLVGRVGSVQCWFAAGFVVVAMAVDLTHVRREWSRVEELVLAIKVGLVALALTATASFLLKAPISRILFLSVAIALVVVRPLLAYTLHRFERSELGPRTVVLVCDDDELAQMQEAIAGRKVDRLRVVARLRDDVVVPPRWDQARHYYEGPVKDLPEVCQLLAPWRVVCGSERMAEGSFLSTLATVHEMGVPIRTFPALFEEEFGRVPLRSLDASWFLFDVGPLHRLGYRAARRVVDLLAGVVTASVFVLTYPLVALAIRSESKGPVLYRQERVGQGGQVFDMVKYRTMRNDAEVDGPQFTSDKDARATRVGQFLRRSHLDELPQCINLLRGDMSLIGPRPERPAFVATYSRSIPFYAKRHLIKPGLTGWAQVHEGYGSSHDDTWRKLERDLYYLKYQSLGIDIRVLVATARTILALGGR